MDFVHNFIKSIQPVDNTYLNNLRKSYILYDGVREYNKVVT